MTNAKIGYRKPEKTRNYSDHMLRRYSYWMIVKTPASPENFRPPWYLRSGHLQTILTGFYKPKAPIPKAVEHQIPIEPYGKMLVYENGPEINDCFRVDPPSSPDEGIFLLHGLGSSHRGTYMTHVAHSLLKQGKRVFRFDLPGAGGSYEHTYLPPHGACSLQLWQAIQFLSENCGIRKWRGIGVSLGGNLLLKLLATHYANACSSANTSSNVSTLPFCIDKAIAVAPPIDLKACCENMEVGVNRIYAKYFLRRLKAQTKIRAERWPQWDACLQNASFRSIREFDNTVTSPLAGFVNADDYYIKGSAACDLKAVQVPTIVLVDADDPIVPWHIFEHAAWSPSTQMIVTRRGGHVGYLYREPTQKKLIRWADHWLANMLLDTPAQKTAGEG